MSKQNQTLTTAVLEGTDKLCRPAEGGIRLEKAPEGMDKLRTLLFILEDLLKSLTNWECAV